MVSDILSAERAAMQVEECAGTIVSIPFRQHKIDALWYHLVTHEEHLKHRPVILRLHGLLGNLLDETEHFLPHMLAEAGYSSLTMNTALANLGLFFGFGLFDEAMTQIDAAYTFLRQVGFQKIVVAGHGLGGCMAIRYGALRNRLDTYPELVGIIAIATPYSLPDTIRHRWDRFGSEPSYAEVHRKAQHLFSSTPANISLPDEIIVVKRAHGPTALPEHTDLYTLKTWWALAGPEAEGAQTYRHIRQVTVPILLVNGLQDDSIAPQEGQDLERIARDSGNSAITQVSFDTNHTFAGKHQELGDLIRQWLTDRCVSA